jgi:hypothetical protein
LTRIGQSASPTEWYSPSKQPEISSVQWPDIRLVDGDLPSEGRLQINYKGKWHSVCTNSKNWTKTDIETVCRQLGFSGGVWYHWFHKYNDSRQFLYENPNCTGFERSIQDCSNWNSKRIGSGICDYHTDIGIRCSQKFNHEPYYWRGIEFIDAETTSVQMLSNKWFRSVSNSILENVVITYAGEDRHGNGTSAIHVRGMPPIINEIEVKWSAFNGINVTNAKEAFDITNSRFVQNRGYGIYVNSSWGRVSLTGVHVESNGADGVRYVFHDEPDFSKESFCHASNLGKSQVFPIRLTHQQTREQTSTKECCQEFYVNDWEGQRLTAHFPVLMSADGHLRDRERSRNGSIYVIDGYSGNKIADFVIWNNTRPQSVSSPIGSGPMKICYRPAVYRSILFTVAVAVDFGRSYDLNITDSRINGNNGRGVWVGNQRSGTVLNRTVVSDNNYVAGVHMLGGSGDIIVNNSLITHNIGDGINISLSGGYKHIDRTQITNNTLRGIASWINETSSQIAFNFSSQVTHSLIMNNGEIGLLMSNICRSDSFWNISMNSFSQNFGDAIELISCWNPDPEKVHMTELLITHNRFEANIKRAITIAPVFYVKALIEHNIFTSHSTGVIYINNRDIIWDDFNYEEVPVNVIIQNNKFLSNHGIYVANIGLHEESNKQMLLFTKNVLKDNVINEPFSSLNPRSRVAAVVVVSSSNTIVIRNQFENRDSRFELGAHLEIHSKVINASYNYWNSGVAIDIYERIFDRKNRYNLAQIEFLQYLTLPDSLDSHHAVSFDTDRNKLMNFLTNISEIGGEVRGQVFLDRRVYTVRRDIYVRPEGELIIPEGAELHFDQSIGVMIQGKFKAKGGPNPLNYIKFTLASDANKPRNPLVMRSPSKIISLPSFPMANNTKNSTKKSSQPINISYSPTNIMTVRLSNGTEGRLEVKVGKEWGTVCSYGFDINDAAVACQQMGYVLNSRDWLLQNSQFLNAGNSRNVLLSDLKCTHLDTDITNCRSQRFVDNDFENSCPSVVGIKCYLPSWTGIRIGVLSEEAHLENAIIERAGLLDYSTHAFKPALQIDFNRFSVKKVIIRENSDAGLGIMWNDVFSNRDNLNVMESEISANLFHGITTRSQGIRVVKSYLHNNRGSGFHYEPTFSNFEQKDLVAWISPIDQSTVTILPNIDSDTQNLKLGNHKAWYMFVKKKPASSIKTHKILVEANIGRSIGIMVLNPVFEDSTESLKLYSPSDMHRVWDLRMNLTSFPLLYPGYKITIEYKTGDNPKGGIVLYFTTKEILWGNPNIKPEHLQLMEERLMTTITLESNEIISNSRGISSNHFNRDVSPQRDYYHRYCNETIFIKDNKIHDNDISLFINTPFYDPLEFTLAEINYTLIGNEFKKNNGGIVQYSRDIRSSNNLFHWVINNSIIEDNSNGGVFIKLPYVWKYNENYTHSLSINNNTFINNRNFEFSIDGHFARINMTQNLLKDNHCKIGLISIAGMEKEMLIFDNVMVQNFVQFVVELNLQSHADKFGVVDANFQRNIIRDNRESNLRRIVDKYHPDTYAFALRGVQEVNITNNILSNRNLQFEFLAGVLTGSLDSMINVAENWWGTTDPNIIRKRIFDFDDWNSFAVALFSPFLSRESFEAGTISSDIHENVIDIEQPFGGRLHKSLVLSEREKPYIINADLTVMPEATLTINSGVVLEFFPSVGMLVLGEMMAGGMEDKPIIMRAVKFNNELRFKRQHRETRALVQKSPYAISIGDVRLCLTEGCEEGSNFKRSDGFVEVFNLTTLQWAPICDQRFTERNAQVICRQLGYSTLNVHLKRGRRLDMGQTLISRIRHWPEPLECIGKEMSLAECDIRLNGYGNHSYSCAFDGEEFVYVYCGKDNKPENEEHWGGIRFALSGFERKTEYQFPTRIYYEPTSKLQFVNIKNAGILHGEKSAAIQMVQRDVNLEFVKVESCAYHAIEAIAPPGQLTFHRLNLHDNLGAGLNYVLLSGSSTESPIIPYKPLTISGLPYSVFGMVDICETSKELIIEERILLYYKYDNRPVDCVKIFTSAHPIKRVGFRLLQYNLFNSSNFSAIPDSLRIWDGDIFNITSQLIGDISVRPKTLNTEEHPEIQFYSSTEFSLSVQLHATGASGDYGFIAEVATLPVSYYIGRGLFHNVTYSEISRNTLGAFQYRSAGESTPTVSMHHNIISDNCLELYGNFSTCNGSVYLELQNSQFLYFFNNLVEKNEGGLHVIANSHSSVSSVTGVVFNNLFVDNHNNEVIYFEGAKSGRSYQSVDITRNYFTRNRSKYRSNILLSQVIANFSQNIVVSNLGQNQLTVYGFEHVPLSYQTCRHNWFYNNIATKYQERSTVIASNAGQVYVDNYFVNPDNDFELATMNRTNLDDLRRPSIKAVSNWWGFNETSAVEARIRDYKDYYHLIPIEYKPFYTDNSSVLSGNCYGGWEKIGETCFSYIGARMTYNEARRFCETENSSMPFIRVNHEEVTRFIYTQQHNFDRRYHRVWVQSFEIDVEECGVLINGRVKIHDCNEKLPFVCEKDPDIRVSISYWYREPLGIAALTISSITALFTLICISCWLCKSRHRYKEKLERRNSIRASIRSNRSFSSSMNTLSNSETGYRKQIEKAIQVARLQQQPTTTSSVYSQKMNGSVDSMEKSASQFGVDSSYDGDSHSYQTSQKADDYSDIGDRFADDPKLENANINILVHPTFDLTFENQGFRATPSMSRTSEPRVWTPTTDSTLDMKRGAQSLTPTTPYAQYKIPIQSFKESTESTSSSSVSKSGRTSPSPPLPHIRRPLPYRPPDFPQKPQFLSTFSPSHPSSITGASSDSHPYSYRPDSQHKYLETSLDGDSYVENIYDDYQLNRFSPTVSTNTSIESQTNKSKPLETAM